MRKVAANAFGLLIVSRLFWGNPITLTLAAAKLPPGFKYTEPSGIDRDEMMDIAIANTSMIIHMISCHTAAYEQLHTHPSSTRNGENCRID